MTGDELLFFNAMPGALPIYDALRTYITETWPQTAVKVARTQITFRDRYGFAFVSLRRMKGCPETFLIFTLGLPYRLSSSRAALAVEPYPGRWTTHFILSHPDQVDGELKGWIDEAHAFALAK